MYYSGFRILKNKALQNEFPFSLPIFQSSEGLVFEKPISIFVGENGSGKSTLLESLALSMNLPAIGSETLDKDQSLDDLHDFAHHIRGSWSKRTHNGFFFRAEDYFGFVKRLKNADIEFENDIADFEKKLSGTGLKQAVGSILGQKEALKRKYGDLNKISHGQGFLKVLQERIQPEGIYLIDEPEAALSPQRQLSLYAILKNMVEEAKCQFILATHSPILMTLPDSQIFEFDETINEVAYTETEHFTVMQQFLNNPDAFTRFL